MTLAPYLAYCGLCLVLAITPGPDTFLVLRYSMRRARSGLAAGLGSGIGSLLWAALVAVGLAAIIAQSAEAYRILKVLGGLYLIYLGMLAFHQSRRSNPSGRAGEGADAAATAARSLLPRRARFSAFGAGLVSTSLNPKVGLFYLAIVPQFLPADGDRLAVTMVLGVTCAVIGTGYLALLTLIAARATAWLSRPRVTVALERASGAILAGLGAVIVVTAALE